MCSNAKLAFRNNAIVLMAAPGAGEAEVLDFPSRPKQPIIRLGGKVKGLIKKVRVHFTTSYVDIVYHPYGFHMACSQTNSLMFHLDPS